MRRVALVIGLLCVACTSAGTPAGAVENDSGVKPLELPSFPRQQPDRVVTLAAQDSLACVLLDNREIWCWGSNECGGMGISDLFQYYEPERSEVSGVRHLSVNALRSCGVWPNGDAYCWGFCAPGVVLHPIDSGVEEIGYTLARAGTRPLEFDWDKPTLHQVSGPEAAKVARIGQCYIGLTNEIYCWGFNADGEVGDGTFEQRLEPTRVLLDAALSVAGIDTKCALLTDGDVACWGDNVDGTAGVDPAIGIAIPTPSRVAMPEEAVAVEVGGAHACALGKSGTVWCWGNNVWSQLGNGDPHLDFSFEPVRVLDLPPASAISAAAFHTCAVVDDLDVYCWGSNSSGQLGNGCCGKYPTTAVAVVPHWMAAR